MPFDAASPMPVRHIQFPTLRHGLPQHSRVGQPLPSTLIRTVHPPAIADDQHPAQPHAEQQRMPPVVAPGLLSVAAITAPAFQTVTAGLGSEAVREPFPVDGRAQLPRQLPVGSSLQGAKAKAHAGPLLSGSVSTPVTDPSLQQLPQQLPHAVTPRPHVSWPQPVVGWPQQTLRPQISQQHTTTVRSPNPRSGLPQHQARHDAAGLLKTVAHDVGVGSARPASASQGADVRSHESWQQLQQLQHAQQQQPQHAQPQQPQHAQQQPPQHAQQQQSGSALGQSHLQTRHMAQQERLDGVLPQGEDAEREKGISSKRGFNTASLDQNVTDLPPAPAAAAATAAATAATVADVTARVQAEAGPSNKRSALYLKGACMQTATMKHSDSVLRPHTH